MSSAPTVPNVRMPKECVTIRFPLADAEESYQLLELPPEILKVVEGGEVVPLTIKGRPSDEAVLCTADKTYALRTVAISNSLLVLRSPGAPTQSPAAATLHIRDVCHEVLECVPAAGRVERLLTVLRESAWGGLDAGSSGGRGMRAGDKRRRGHGAGDGDGKRYSRLQLSSIIQASEAELARALRDNNVVEVGGYMLLLPPAQLGELLTLVLTLLTIHVDDAEEPIMVSAHKVAGALEDDHDVDPELCERVMRLFGSIEGDLWECDVKRVVREVGKGLLVNVKEPSPSDDFLAAWRAATGEPWCDHADLSLLVGEYLLSDAPPSAFTTSCPRIQYFPTHALPLHPPTRFSDLFLTRPRWRPAEMEPFLAGLFREGDTKARDKLVAKYVRVVKEREGTWWYPRRMG